MLFFRSIGHPARKPWHIHESPFFNESGWPSSPAWRLIQAPGSTIITTDALSDPFISQPTEPGLGFELLCECQQEFQGNMAARTSWLFDILFAVSEFVVQFADFKAMLDVHKVGTIQIPYTDPDLEPFAGAEGFIGVFVGQPLPNHPSSFCSPAGPVSIFTVKLLTPAELQFALDGGQSGSEALQRKFTETSTHHLSSLNRPSVI
ncbi:MAG: suppressor of fused domain protein [Planctomycetaceae bacterium]